MLTTIINCIRKFKEPIKNFLNSSVLSLLVIVLILLILFKMDQAYTIMVLMLEEDKFSLLVCFFFVNALALLLSHYPIYTYYFKGANRSTNAFNWKVFNYNFFGLKYPLFVFERKKDVSYTINVTANVLRYSLGIFIYAVWVIFVYKSVKPNLQFNDGLLLDLEFIPWIIGLFFSMPFITYSILKVKLTYKIKDEEEKNKLYAKVMNYLFFFALASLLMLVFILFNGEIFSRYGFILVMLCTYNMMFCYVFFRLVRAKLNDIHGFMVSGEKKHKLSWFAKLLKWFQKPENYLRLFIFNFLIAVVFIIYWNLGTLFGYPIKGNVISILLVYMYAYYWILANISKYFLVAKKATFIDANGEEKKYSDMKRYKLSFMGVFVFFVLVVISAKWAEQHTHEIEKVANTNLEERVIHEDKFIKSVGKMKGDHVFFVSSYGGGLKANAWTLNVVNELQKKTSGDFFNRTVSLSGASGGSLGLAVYTGLYSEYEHQYKKIDSIIREISRDDYASGDLAFTLGLDFYRKVWPLTNGLGMQDRAYYSMIKYQNHIQKITSDSLDTIAFREYWKRAYDNKYFPSLIMNTAGIRANRGLLWSVKDNETFDLIFPNADNLADLRNNKTLPFYQAVSMTNRFPGLSPAAKVKNYGHYMDAGVFDNSGMLGNLDVYNYLRSKDDGALFYNKKVVFVDIINSKDLYVEYVIKEIARNNNLDLRNVDEAEKDNLVVNFQSALDYNKIPKYLGDFFENWEKKTSQKTDSISEKILYRPIYLPHKITVADVEKYVMGDFPAEMKIEIKNLLDSYNQLILTKTNTNNTPFWDDWDFYEPTLSRHMGKSSYDYMTQMIKNHDSLKAQFNKIEQLIQ